MICCIRTTAACNFTVLTGFIAASGGALFGAIYSQLVLGLDPCVLCLYQRVPYFTVIGLSCAGLLLKNNQRVVKFILALCALAFLINTGIATYHSGVERKWWVSDVEGCAVPDFSKDPSLLEKILTAPSAHCDVIAWKDPFIGLSMANYNALFSLLLFGAGLVALSVRPRQKPSEGP